MAKTTALKLPNGNNIYAGEGAVRQDGSLKVYTCNECGGEVVWAKSSRTGRFYLVNVSKGHADQRFYMKHNAHNHDARDAQREFLTNRLNELAGSMIDAREARSEYEKGTNGYNAFTMAMDSIREAMDSIRAGLG